MLIETVAMARLTLWVQPVLLLLAATGAFVAGVVLQLAPSIALSSILFVLTGLSTLHVVTAKRTSLKW